VAAVSAASNVVALRQQIPPAAGNVDALGQPPSAVLATDRILRVAAVVECIGLSRPTIYRRIKKGIFPPAVSLGGKSVGWRASEINAWIAQCDRAGAQ
jgi:prophage regulatory protein